MKTTLTLILMIVAAAMPEKGDGETAGNPRVLLETSKGDIVLELFATKAPETVKNFLGYVRAGVYDGTIFHRVIPSFMIQGGGFSSDMKRRPSREPIHNEADNGLENNRGTVAMARTQEPHSATNQFFINVVNNDFLNHKSKDPHGWGYAVFGRVTQGMDVVDAISRVKTGNRGPFNDVPIEPVVIQKVSLMQ